MIFVHYHLQTQCHPSHTLSRSKGKKGGRRRDITHVDNFFFFPWSQTFIYIKYWCLVSHRCTVRILNGNYSWLNHRYNEFSKGSEIMKAIWPGHLKLVSFLRWKTFEDRKSFKKYFLRVSRNNLLRPVRQILKNFQTLQCRHPTCPLTLTHQYKYITIVLTILFCHEHH